MEGETRQAFGWLKGFLALGHLSPFRKSDGDGGKKARCPSQWAEKVLLGHAGTWELQASETSEAQMLLSCEDPTPLVMLGNSLGERTAVEVVAFLFLFGFLYYIVLQEGGR